MLVLMSVVVTRDFSKEILTALWHCSHLCEAERTEAQIKVKGRGQQQWPPKQLSDTMSTVKLDRRHEARVDDHAVWDIVRIWHHQPAFSVFVFTLVHKVYCALCTVVHKLVCTNQFGQWARMNHRLATNVWAESQTLWQSLRAASAVSQGRLALSLSSKIVQP